MSLLLGVNNSSRLRIVQSKSRNEPHFKYSMSNDTFVVISNTRSLFILYTWASTENYSTPQKVSQQSSQTSTHHIAQSSTVPRCQPNQPTSASPSTIIPSTSHLSPYIHPPSHRDSKPTSPNHVLPPHHAASQLSAHAGHQGTTLRVSAPQLNFALPASPSLFHLPNLLLASTRAGPTGPQSKQNMSHETVYYSRPRTYGKGSREW